MRISLAFASAMVGAVKMNTVFADEAVLSGEAAAPIRLINNNVGTNNGFRADSKAASGLLASSTRLLEDGYDNSDFISGYSVKFQGCHHISQWNSDADGDSTVRIKSKRLVRFRLCPSSTCDSNNSAGCKSKFGDYVVDLNTFVYYYLQADAEEQEARCEEYKETCKEECNSEYDAYNYCQQQCYKDHGIRNGCGDNDDDDAANIDFDTSDYAQCAAYKNFYYDNTQNYIGPYCAEQGGSIYLGLFSDDTCTTFSSCGETCFYNEMGFKLPYGGGESLVDTQCHSCSENYLEKEQGAYYADDDDLRDFCKSIYDVSGKCEARMNTQYPNDSACTYIEGIKIIRDDGVLRTSGMRKSKPAAVAIGLLSTSSVLLVAYVYYLRTKLSRAKVNLSSTSNAVYA